MFRHRSKHLQPPEAEAEPEAPAVHESQYLHLVDRVEALEGCIELHRKAILEILQRFSRRA
ncbi:MAG: hypothetical protein IH936_15265 [Acidobacteria bacterium]|nr:hypothetical protein [Acidobacteriota bacterium]